MFFNLLHGYVANDQTLQAEQCASEAPVIAMMAMSQKIGRTTTVETLVGRSCFEGPVKVIQLS